MQRCFPATVSFYSAARFSSDICVRYLALFFVLKEQMGIGEVRNHLSFPRVMPKLGIGHRSLDLPHRHLPSHHGQRLRSDNRSAG